MKEPIYECQNCGRDLTSKQIGKVVWCDGCQLAFDFGFNEGLRAGRHLMKLDGDIKDWMDALDKLNPYKVRE